MNRSWEVYNNPELVRKLLNKWGYPCKDKVKRYEDLMKKAAKLVVGKSVLDVGCGFGNLRYYLPTEISYTGIDVSEDVIETAKMKARSIHPPVDFFIGDVYDLSKFEKFDTVFALSLLIHLPSSYEPLQEMLKHTNKALIFSTYIGKEEKIEIKEVGYDNVNYGGIIYRHETQESLHKRLRKLGQEVFEVYGFDHLTWIYRVWKK